jgi:hypothetical protein
MKCVLIFLIFFLPILSHGQNLVVNGSFEDTCNCGTDRCGPAGWLYLRKIIATGYNHMVDGVLAFDGSQKLCFTIGNRYDDRRTYWETILIRSLQKDVKYKLTMHIHGWGNWPNLNDLGLWFVDSLFFVDIDTILQPKHYIDMVNARVRQEKDGWFKVEKDFVSYRNANYMIVGNISPNDYQKVAWERHSNSFYICGFMDDISIEPLVKTPCTDCPRIRDSIYLVSQKLSTQQNKEVVQEKPRPTPVIPAPKTVDTVELPSLLFAFNSWKMKDSSGLGQYTNLLSNPKIRGIVVVGYTESVPTPNKLDSFLKVG